MLVSDAAALPRTCLVGRRLGYRVSLNTRADKQSVFRLTFTRAAQRRPLDAIKKKRVLREAFEGYVYDVETENHHFHVGPGRLVVHNTDSCMIRFDGADVGAVMGQPEMSWAG